MLKSSVCTTLCAASQLEHKLADTDQITISALASMSCSTAEDLSHDVWVQILHHVDLKQRLSACALVCKKLARAAAAAAPPDELDLEFEDSPQRLDAFLTCWSSAHGSSLTKLHLSATRCLASSHSNPIRQLPCPNLLELKLVDCRVQLCASSEGPGLLHTCTALTALILNDPILLDGDVDAPAGAVPAAAVARLQHLELTQPQAAGPEGQGSGAEVPLDILLPHLTSLTCLSFWTYYRRSCFLQHISTLVGLEKLFLGSAGEGGNQARPAVLPSVCLPLSVLVGLHAAAAWMLDKLSQALAVCGVAFTQHTRCFSQI
jgi:hypothetical protein